VSETKLQPGESRSFTVKPAKQSYKISCEIHEDKGTEGDLTGERCRGRQRQRATCAAMPHHERRDRFASLGPDRRPSSSGEAAAGEHERPILAPRDRPVADHEIQRLSPPEWSPHPRRR